MLPIPATPNPNPRTPPWTPVPLFPATPFSNPGPARSARRRSRASDLSISAPPSTRRWRKSAPRSTRSPPIRKRRRSTIRSARWSAAARRSIASPRCSSISPARTATTRWKRSSAKSRRSWRASATRSFSTTRCSSASKRCTGAQAALALDAEAARALDRYRTAFLRAGAGLAPDKKARLAAIGERLATLGAAVRAERARRRKGVRR